MFIPPEFVPDPCPAMSLWTEEGVAGVGYGHAFYPELSPGVIGYALIHGGVKPPQGVLQGRFSWCDLGCGQGVSVNVLAALYPHSRFEGVDVLPEHIHNARRLAGQAGLTNVSFHQESFARFAEREGDPFDVIVLHGVLSWVGPDARKDLAAILARRLKPGGVVFASYNLLPGWAALAPIRQLLYRHVAAGYGAMEERIERALSFATRLSTLDCGYFARLPGAESHLAGLARKPVSYLAHEYLNRDWAPLYHAEVAELMYEQAGLAYVGSATFADLDDGWSVPMEGIGLMAQVPDRRLRETIRDTLTMNRFRRDLFMAEPTMLSAGERAVLLEHFPLRAAMTADELPAGFSAPQGTVAFGSEHRAALEQQSGAAKVVLGLLSVGALMPVVAGDHEGAARYNRAVLRANRQSPDLSQLAAPGLGGAVDLDMLARLFLLAEMEGASPAAFAAAILAERGKTLWREGNELTRAEEIKAELERLYARFLTRQRQHLEAVGAVP